MKRAWLLFLLFGLNASVLAQEPSGSSGELAQAVLLPEDWDEWDIFFQSERFFRQSSEKRWKLRDRAASLFELSGQEGRALALLQDGWDETGTEAKPQWAYRIGMLQGQLGRWEELQKTIGFLRDFPDPAARTLAGFLDVRRLLAQGQAAEAKVLIDDPAQGWQSPPSPAFLSIMHSVYLFLGDTASMRKTEDLLRKLHPETPETLFLSHPRVQSMALWWRPPAFSGTAPVLPEGSLWLQAGVFSREDNARELRTKLSEAGFEAVLRPIGGRYFVLVATTEPTRDQKRLKEKGFDSFLKTGLME